MEPDSLKCIWEDLEKKIRRQCGRVPERVRQMAPLVHLLTNYVTVNDCVNALLAIGAKGICSHAPQEAAQVTKGCAALVCNLGGTEYYDAMEKSAAAALEGKIPLVIDPVGCAASVFRKDMCMHLIKEFKPAAVRGNYAEITALVNDGFSSSGLDSKASLKAEEMLDFEKRMRDFAGKYGTILIASGAADLCCDGKTLCEITAGTPALRRITGAGCMSSSILAAFLAAENSMEYALGALNFTGLCGEAAHRAALESQTGAGHFHMFFMDALSRTDELWRR